MSKQQAAAVNTLAPSFATWILAQCGDKQAAATIRMETVRGAIVVALKGNKTQWQQAAAAVATKKGTAAAAFKAAFMALGDIGALFKPQDQTVTKEEKAAAIEAKADEMVLTFEAAYLAELPPELTKEQRDAKKAERDANKAKEIAAAVDAEISARGLVKPGTAATDGEILAAALALITGGKCGDTFADEFRAALGVPAMLKQAYADGQAAALANVADNATAGTAPAVTAPAAKKGTAKKGTAPAPV